MIYTLKMHIFSAIFYQNLKHLNYKNYMQNKEIIYVDEKKIKCGNTNDNFGHPLVYLEIKEDQVTCPYCSKIFQLKK